MMTPEPRLIERRSRTIESSSPKKYRKNGSLGNGELRWRTTCSDEMFATPLTAWPATRVKSGPLPVKPEGCTGSLDAAARGAVPGSDVRGASAAPDSEVRGAVPGSAVRGVAVP